MEKHSGVARAILGAVLIAALSTLGDVVWFELHLRHRAVYGVAHGLLLFQGLGLYLGAQSGRPWAGAAGGAAIGLASAGAYYALAPLIGRAAMFVVWMLLWVAVAALVEFLATAVVNVRAVLVRGGVAAIASGLAFYAISGIWSERPATGRNYAVHFASWTVAYLPAFLALLYRRAARNERQAAS